MLTSTPLKLWKGWRKGVACLLAVLLVMICFGWIPYGRQFIEKADRSFGDLIIRYSGGPPEKSNLVLLGIDEKSMSLDELDPEEIAANPTLGMMTARFPWSRKVWADVIDRLADAGAKVIAIDLIFSEPSDLEGDKAFAEALQRHPDKVILVSVISPAGADSHGVGFTFVEPFEDFIYGANEIRFGYANFNKDPVDGLVRSSRYTTTPGLENDGKRRNGEPEFRSFASEIIDAMGGKVPTGEQELRLAGRENTGGADTYAPKSIYGIFADKFWKTNYDSGRFFRDKVVMIGPTSPRSKDIIDTPMGPVTGPQMHMQALACGLDQAFIQRMTNPWPGMVFLGLIALLWTQWVRRPLVSVFGLMLITAGVVLTSMLVGDLFSLVLPVSGGLLALVSGWAVAQSFDLVTERLEKGRLRRDFRRFVSRDVADALVDHPEAWRDASGGVKRRVVVLFSDVRGFTERSEHSDPADLVYQLNEYLTIMVAVVFHQGGTLDKFIGDAVMAHWGALGGGSDEENSHKALLAAREMIDALEKLNAKWTTEGKAPFKIGVGLHLGEVVAGEIGSPDRTEFGIIGDAVNLASRLEGLTKTFGCDVIISEEVRTASRANEGLQNLGKVRVKGRKSPGNLYGIGDENSIREHLEIMERDADGVIVMTTK